MSMLECSTKGYDMISLWWEISLGYTLRVLLGKSLCSLGLLLMNTVSHCARTLCLNNGLNKVFWVLWLKFWYPMLSCLWERSFGALNNSDLLLSTFPSTIFYSHSVFYSKSVSFESAKFSFLYCFYTWCFWISFYFYYEHFPTPVFCAGLLLRVRGESSALLQLLQFMQRMSCALICSFSGVCHWSFFTISVWKSLYGGGHSGTYNRVNSCC